MTNNSQKKISKINLIYNCYLRFLALICLGLGVFYWIRLVGVFPGILWRFDLMPWQWQCLSATLAIVYPIALIGLWMYSPWGIVLWCIAACSETLAMIYYSDHQLFLPMFHGILFLTFITLQIIRQILGQAK
ncbi:hypothetical protein BHOIPH791_03690 [Bartonella henselae]|uniref:Permease of the major facilitator superfamily n=2 Tax=Bartonella henselae TaxID=38323 RepID=A0A0R4J7F3_BARHE|nr:DUF6163 family protein [Bartonella henselae]ATP12359.1 hypothetical protein BhenCHDE101_04130 [Bartonella henselae]ETS07367.1 hypothetical protein Q653_01434 [Bartonella henselae JK 42]ETS08530.1 hypothetical protein Q655_00797 [Bartonella henselae JK 51]ETS09077.1 hypothetical protein Q654_00844 [Bartonella henselae JK 50]ETS12068.1 hypothetical protein Q652_01409 [Bartonella henselae JK 41]